MLLAAFQGHGNPYSYAFIRKYGKAPEKLIPMWAKREEELLKWLDHDPHSQPCLCAECNLKRRNLGLAVQLSLNLAKAVPFPAAASTRDDGRIDFEAGRTAARESGMRNPSRIEATASTQSGPQDSSSGATPQSTETNNLVAIKAVESATPDSDRKSPQPETPAAKKATA